MSDTHTSLQTAAACLLGAAMALGVPRALCGQVASRAGAAPAAAAAGDAPTKGVDPEYLIGPGDVLVVDVWHEPEVTRTLPVRPDGRISLPLAGEVVAAGLTADQLRARLETELEKYIEAPAVSVMVQDAQSRRFNVLNMVNRPGSYALAHPTTVLDAIAEAGGLRDFAHGSRIYILRKRADGSEIQIKFDYNAVIDGRHTEENIQLQPNDTVVVP